MRKDKMSREKQRSQSQNLADLGLATSGIAHDFNNLLTTILGNASLAISELAEDSPVLECLREIETVARHGRDLTRQILNYAGEKTRAYRRLDVNHLIENMTLLLKASISRRTVLEYRLAENLPQIRADAVQIRRVLMNLVVNASRSLGGKVGKIVVATELAEVDRDYVMQKNIAHGLTEGRYVSLEVADTGCGIDAETLPSIFTPFVTNGTGHGLGLSVTLDIAREHRGALTVTSTAGRGTTFTVLIPAVRSLD